MLSIFKYKLNSKNNCTQYDCILGSHMTLRKRHFLTRNNVHIVTMAFATMFFDCLHIL